MTNYSASDICDISYSAMLLAISEAGIHPKNSCFHMIGNSIFAVDIKENYNKLMNLMNKIGDKYCVYNPPDTFHQSDEMLSIIINSEYVTLTKEDIKKIEDAIAKYCLVK